MLKKLGVTVAVCICSLVMTLSVNAATVSKGKVNADALNVRSLPSTSGVSMGLLPTDTEVTILSQHDNWYKINFNGEEAYVCADYIIITEQNVEIPDPQPAATSPVQSVSNGADIFGNANPALVPVATGTIPSYAGSQVPGEMLVEICKQYIGTPYVYGGMSPAGFDCSGFVKYCYSLMGVELNRIANDQKLNGVEVPVNQMLPGDILCFSDSTGSTYIGHTGIYVGNGYFIHSPRTGYTVEIVPLSTTSYGNRIKNVRRIFN